jgi:hypothetical protein
VRATLLCAAMVQRHALAVGHEMKLVYCFLVLDLLWRHSLWQGLWLRLRLRLKAHGLGLQLQHLRGE